MIKQGLRELFIMFQAWVEYRRAKKEELRKCDSCEVLKQTVAEKERLIQQLLDRVLTKPEPIVEKGPPQITKPTKFLPWHVRRQMLQAEDKRKAIVLRQNQKEDEVARKLAGVKKDTPTDDLERDLTEGVNALPTGNEQVQAW